MRTRKIEDGEGSFSSIERPKPVISVVVGKESVICGHQKDRSSSAFGRGSRKAAEKIADYQNRI